MSYESTASDVVKIVEAVGGGIMIVGGLIAFARYGRRLSGHGSDAFDELRTHLGRVILLGLEVLIMADIIRTIVVDQSPASVRALGLIVLIRIVLSFSLEVEIGGYWPWDRWRRSTDPAPKPGPALED